MGEPTAEFCSRWFFFFLFSGAMRAPLRLGPCRRALLSRAGRRLLLGPRPPWVRPWSFAGRPPPPWAGRWIRCYWPGAILGAGSSSSARICARRCWRSPLMTRYRPDPISPWILAMKQKALGDPQALGGGLLSGRLRARLPVRSAQAPRARPLEPWPMDSCPRRTRDPTRPISAVP